MKPFSVCLALTLGVAAAECRATLILDGSFETATVSGPGDFVYNPTDTPWTFTGTSGVARDKFSGGFGVSGAVPDGLQFAFAQASGSFSQTVNLPSDGIYVLSFFEAGREAAGSFGGNQTYDVLLDTTVLHSGATTSFQPFESVSFEFNASAGSHLLTFLGTTTFVGRDDTAFFDAVHLAVVPEPSSLAMLGLVALLGLGVIGLGNGVRLEKASERLCRKPCIDS